MKTPVQRFAAVEKAIKSKSWFKRDGWIVSTHGFPHKNPQFITFHVSKAHWYNEDKQGIHFESFLAFDPKKQKKSYVTLHLLHASQIPQTKISRKVLAKEFVDSVFDEVSSWDGYSFRAGRYGVQPFTMTLDGESSEFEEKLALEVIRLCTQLGPKIDKALKKVLKTG